MNPFEHVANVKYHFAKEIANSVVRTKVFRGEAPHSRATAKGKGWALVPADSVSAAFEYGCGDRTCILNFASHKNPGGKYLQGSTTQEESLCAASTLYPVIASFDDYYEQNKTALNRALYTNAALYSPDILFFRGKEEPKMFDVLTCAAPNYSHGKRYGTVTPMENSDVLRDRVKFMFDVADANGVNCLVLGAWGCGVFKQDPYEVVDLMIEYGKKSGVGRIVFAIPNDRSANYRAFKEALDHAGLI